MIQKWIEALQGKKQLTTTQLLHARCNVHVHVRCFFPPLQRFDLLLEQDLTLWNFQNFVSQDNFLSQSDCYCYRGFRSFSVSSNAPLKC